MQIQPKADKVVEEGWYPARIKALEAGEGNFGPQFMWRYVATEGDEDFEVVGWTSQSDSMKSNLVKYAKEILGDVSDGFDTSDLEGRPCRIYIENYEKEGEEKNKVTKVKKLKDEAVAPSLPGDDFEKDLEVEPPF